MHINKNIVFFCVLLLIKNSKLNKIQINTSTTTSGSSLIVLVTIFLLLEIVVKPEITPQLLQSQLHCGTLSSSQRMSSSYNSQPVTSQGIRQKLQRRRAIEMGVDNTAD